MGEPKVLLISGEYPPMEGGVADFTAILGEHLAEQGAQVHVLTSSQVTLPAAGQVRVHPLESWSWKPLWGTMRRLLRELEPDVVNIQYQTAAYGMHPAINLLPRVFRRAPFVVTFHDLLAPYLFPKAGPLRWWVNLALARGSDAVIVTNAEDRARLAATRWISPLALIPIGSNITPTLPPAYNRQEWRQHWRIPEDALLLCYFGFLNESKGADDLIAALQGLRWTGHDARLLMIGGATGASDPTNWTYLELVKRNIRERGLEEQVIWTGHLPDEEVSASFCGADICVLPYRDGVSFRRGSLMAALAHSMPIISTYPQVDLPELVHGGNIWLVPPRDPQALTRAIARLASDQPLRQSLGAGARALSHRFRWPQIAMRTLEIYHDVTDRTG